MEMVCHQWKEARTQSGKTRGFMKINSSSPRTRSGKDLNTIIYRNFIKPYQVKIKLEEIVVLSNDHEVTSSLCHCTAQHTLDTHVDFELILETSMKSDIFAERIRNIGMRHSEGK